MQEGQEAPRQLPPLVPLCLYGDGGWQACLCAAAGYGKSSHDCTPASWTSPSTTTVMSFKPQGISYENKSLKQSAQAFTG